MVGAMLGRSQAEPHAAQYASPFASQGFSVLTARSATQPAQGNAPVNAAQGIMTTISYQPPHLELLHAMCCQVYPLAEVPAAATPCRWIIWCPVPQVAACQVLDQVPGGVSSASSNAQHLLNMCYLPTGPLQAAWQMLQHSDAIHRAAAWQMLQLRE